MKANPDLRKRVCSDFLEYYSKEEVQKDIVEQHKFRETGLISITLDKEFPKKKIRNLKLDNLSSFKYTILNAMEYFREPYNIYHSCAKYDNGLPIFFFSGMKKEEIEQRKKEWVEECNNKIISYDYYIDIDSPSFEALKLCADDTLNIYKKIIKKKDNVKLIFSGCGFHIVIPEYLKKCPTEKDVNDLKKEVKKFNLKDSELVDYQVISLKRIKKTVNTLCFREGYKNIMLSRYIDNPDELKNFDYKKYVYKKVE